METALSKEQLFLADTYRHIQTHFRKITNAVALGED